MTAATRARLLTRGLRLEYVTVGWNIAEGVIAVGAGLAAGTLAMPPPRPGLHDLTLYQAASAAVARASGPEACHARPSAREPFAVRHYGPAVRARRHPRAGPN